MYIASDKRYEKMKYNRCGKSGLLLPAVSLGLWHNFGDTGVYANMEKLCKAAFDNGITHFDLANNYGPAPGSAEKNFGRILKENFLPYRDEMIISTKAGYTMWEGPYGDWGSRKYLLASLDRGKALYAGLSNYDGPTLEKASAILTQMRVPFVINQNRYNILDRTIEKNGLKETAARLGKGIICFTPLAQGVLTDRYLNGIPADSRVRTDGRFLSEKSLDDAKIEKARKLNEIAGSRGQTLAEMALAWILRDGAVTSVLIGASKTSQILDNIKAIGNTVFTDEELALIDAAALER